MHGLALCAGVDGFGLGLRLAIPGYRTICHVEREAHAAAVLVSRMADGTMDLAPVWSDLATFDGIPWRGIVDIITAGFPCQPWSYAGKQRGTSDERWLWPHIARIIRAVRPSIVFVENVPGLVDGGLGHVLGDLAESGYDAEWDVFRASDVGATHRRARLFVLAHLDREGLGILRKAYDYDGCHASGCDADGRGAGMGDVRSEGRESVVLDRWSAPSNESRDTGRYLAVWPPGRESDYAGIDVSDQPAMARVAHGPTSWVDEVRASGNCVVPVVAAYAFVTLSHRMYGGPTGNGSRR